MLEQFKSFIEKNVLSDPDDRILCTVSGGIDSVVMLDLFVKAGYHCSIAHCNFNLRGQESDADETFVKDLAEKYNLRFYGRQFNTEEYARDNRISIQMAARDLRYKWFEEIRSSEGFGYYATAHNQDDIIETFFINLARGTGIRGLTGIRTKSGFVIRPLLFASRIEITDYATDCGLKYREDSSNASVKYTRNKIRHEILPIFEAINPSFRRSLIDTIRKLHDAEEIYLSEISLTRGKLLRKKDKTYFIALKDLLKLPNRQTYLFELLSEFNFIRHQVYDINESLTTHPGKQFFSPTHMLVKDRTELIITPIEEEEFKRFYIEEGTDCIHEPVKLEFMVIDMTSSFHIPADPFVACLDYEMLTFPLLIRKWQEGDFFQPLGMQHRKKLSDFLIDQKLSIIEKKNTWLLLNGEDIVWVIRHRIDERYKIADKTRQVLMIRML